MIHDLGIDLRSLEIGAPPLAIVSVEQYLRLRADVRTLRPTPWDGPGPLTRALAMAHAQRGQAGVQ